MLTEMLASSSDFPAYPRAAFVEGRGGFKSVMAEPPHEVKGVKTCYVTDS